MLELLLEYGFAMLSMLCLPVALALFAWWAFRPSKKILYAGLLSLAIYIAGYARMQYAGFWLMDDCLDQGGSWDEQQGSCLQPASSPH